MKIVWSPNAEDDLQAITDYIALDDVPTAQQFAQRLRDSVARLSDFPRLGRPVREGGLRQLGFYPYLVHYVLRDEAVWIVGIKHGARDPRRWS